MEPADGSLGVDVPLPSPWLAGFARLEKQPRLMADGTERRSEPEALRPPQPGAQDAAADVEAGQRAARRVHIHRQHVPAM